MLISKTIDPYKSELGGARSPNTEKKYLQYFTAFTTLIGDKDITEICYEDVSRFRAHLARKGCSTSYIATALSGIIFYLEFLIKFYKLRTLYMKDIRDLRPSVRQKSPEAKEPWEVTALIDAAESSEDKAIISLLFYLGLRSDELLHIKKTDFKDKEINIDGSSRIVKHLSVIGKGNKHRLIPIPEKAVEYLNSYMTYLSLGGEKKSLYKNARNSDKDDYIFKMSYMTMWRRVREAGKKANIKIRPHMLRHTFGTELHNEGNDLRTVSDLMGHSDLNVTSRYVHVKSSAKVKAVESLSLPVKKKTGKSSHAE